jgi:hypothetical protein
MRFRKFSFLLILVSVAAASFGVTAAARRPYFRFIGLLGGAQTLPTRSAVPWVPYEITLRQYATIPDSDRTITAADMVRAVRGDGASVETVTSYRVDGSVGGRARYLDLPGGIHIKTEEDLGLMTATKDQNADEAFIRRQLDPSQSCAVSLSGGHPFQVPVIADETFLGMSVKRIYLGGDTSRQTFWRSPALRCAELRAMVERIDPRTGKVVGISDRVAVTIHEGDPDTALFELPHGFRNVAPSERASAHAHYCCNATLTATDLARIAPADEHFEKYRFDF